LFNLGVPDVTQGRMLRLLRTIDNYFQDLMSSLNSNLAFPLILFLKFCFTATALCDSAEKDSLKKSQDTLYVQQHLYYGRVWRDLYSRSVTGDEYLYSKDFLPGTVTFNSRLFIHLKVRYDIFNDEIMILTYQGNVL
jgi:hypothetical protein